MLGDNRGLQPLPVERAAGLPDPAGDGNAPDIVDSDPAALQLEKRSLLAGHRGTISEGMSKPEIPGVTRFSCTCILNWSAMADVADLAPKQQRRYFSAAMFCLVATLLSADQNLLAPNLTAVARDFNFTDAERDKYLGGVISAAFFLLGAPAALVIGYLSDTMNRAKLLFWVVLLGILFCSMSRHQMGRHQ